MILCVTLLILSGSVSVAERFKVIGPEEAVVADDGKDVVLPCSLQPITSAENMMVSWLKNNVIVHNYENHTDRNDKQSESYRGRTDLFKEELKNGIVSLKLSAVQLSDEGTYTCLVVSRSGYETAAVYLKVRDVPAAGKIALICISVLLLLLVLFISVKIMKNVPAAGKIALICIPVLLLLLLLLLLLVLFISVKIVKDVPAAGKIALICISVLLLLLLLLLLLVLFISVKIMKRKKIEREFTRVKYSAVAREIIRYDVREEFNLKKYNTTEEGHLCLIPAITNCRKAVLAGCNLSDQLMDKLREVLLSENSSLKELDLSDNDLSGSRLKKLCDGLKRLETPRSVSIRMGNNHLQDSGAEKLCYGLKSKHCKLETLRLAQCRLGKQSCKHLRSVLLENSSLKNLDLSNNHLQGSGVKELCDGLKSSLCKLETLRLNFCVLSEDSCDSLASVLSSGSTLKELDLSNNDLKDSGVKELCNGLKSSHCKLETLRLAGCRLGKQSCEHLKSVLLENSSLKNLDLSYNDLEDSGVKELCDGLKSPRCKLRLSRCMITEEGCSSLSDSSKVKELDLSYNHPGTQRVDPTGGNRIKKDPKKYACELTLDPNTVNTLLSLSEGNRKVKWVEERQSYPYQPERFSHWEQVLCRESLTGRCYWETEWSGRGVHISVAYKSIRRKGVSADCGFGANEKSWSLFCSNNSYSVCHNKNSTALPPPPPSSKRVGVYVDCPAGTLSFYRVSTDTHTLTHLHTFTTTFTEPLCAGFRVDAGSSVTLCEIK